jgi:hypothetical protein
MLRNQLESIREERLQHHADVVLRDLSIPAARRDVETRRRQPFGSADDLEILQSECGLNQEVQRPVARLDVAARKNAHRRPRLAGSIELDRGRLERLARERRQRGECKHGNSHDRL